MNAPPSNGGRPASTAPLRRRKLRPRTAILLLLFGCGVAVVAAEIAVRVWLRFADPDNVAASRQRMGAAKPAPGEPYRLGHLIRAASNPDIIFELIPGLDVEFLGKRLVTDGDGFRSPARPRVKAPNGFRIVGIGDSVLFGWGVDYEDSALPKLEKLVQAACPDRVVDSVNTAVPGYNTAMEEHVLRDKGLQWGPDLVVVDFVGNDLDLPNYLRRSPDYWRLDHSYLLDLVRDKAPWRGSELHGPFVWAPARGDGTFERDPARVPDQYKHLVGIEAYRRAMQAILVMGREHGFHVLVSCHHLLWPEVRQVCADLQVPVVEIGAKVNGWLHDHGHQELLGSPLTIDPHDPHPSPMVHTWLAEAVFGKLRELGWLPTTTPR